MTVSPPPLAQGNLVAVKRVNRKRIELTRKVLFELKHVMWGHEATAWGGVPGGRSGGWPTELVVAWDGHLRMVGRQT